VTVRIPSATSSWVPLETYLQNLERAAGGIAKIGLGPAADLTCTGWMLTDSLVVVPSSVLDGGLETPVVCHLPRLVGPAPARVEFMPAAPDAGSSGDPLQMLPALVRLHRSYPDRAQVLRGTRLRPGEPLLLLHYPLDSVELQLSQGRLVNVGSDGIVHDVESAPGSSGAPLLSAETAQVLGMHRGTAHSLRSPIGVGLPLAELLETFLASPAWPEISEFHRLAVVGRPGAQRTAERTPTTSTGDEPPDAALLRAALSWTINPDTLDPRERERIQLLVGDPESSRWSLPGDERQRLIRAAGSLKVLRSAYRVAADPSPGDRVLDRIINGPPLELAEVPDDELPYCLQAVHWLTPVVPGLPSAADVNRELQRRRVRSRLRPVATERLWGREAELARLQGWAAEPHPPAMLVTGIGGMGKSALVARFALDLPDETAILWLDFDRPDLAPDDAVSVLSALAGQLAVQRERVDLPAIDGSNWATAAKALGDALGEARALLVLDGFEVAQHAERHDELWGVLDLVLAQAPGTRVVVSGRAPVPNLRLGGRPAEPMPLTGLPREAARAWLVSRGIRAPAALQAVLRVADGVPLLLKLAVRLVEEGGDVAEVPRSLPRELVDGYLYQRILDRVVDRRLQPLAHDALVLRRITPEILRVVLADRIPEGMDANKAIGGLTREMALVEAFDPPATGPPAPMTAVAALRLRPEVRVATLRLLEIEDFERVNEIDRRTADWYSGPGAAPDDPEARVAAAAEAVYHYVRAGDVDRARAAWVDGSLAFLRGVEDDIPARFSRARRWLRSQVAGGDDELRTSVGLLRSWETSALARIENALARGLDRSVPSILDERPDRSADSPLLAYDAWIRRERGDGRGAAQLLHYASATSGRVGWVRRIVAARTAMFNRDFAQADRLLRAVGSSGPANADQGAAVVAARVRLTVDVGAEVSLLGSLITSERRDDNLEAKLQRLLVPWDFVVPSLRSWFGRALHITLPHIPDAQLAGWSFADDLDTLRERVLRRPVPFSLRVSRPQDPDGTLGPLGPGVPTLSRDLVESVLAQRLADLSAQRWRLERDELFLAQARSMIERSKRFVDQLGLSVAATSAAYDDGLRFTDGLPLSVFVQEAAARAGASMLDQKSVAHIKVQRTILEAVARLDPRLGLDNLIHTFDGPGPYSWVSLPRHGWEDGANALLLFMFGPDPLEELERRALGRPELKAK
jgi:hypothetical protein